MRLIFVGCALDHQGNAQDIYNYIQVAKKIGHEVVLYAPEHTQSWLTCSSDVESADAVIFIAQTNMYLHYGGYLNLVRLLSQVPRERRVVIDCDGKYNYPIRVKGDYNHLDAVSSQHWLEICDSLTDKIFQPTRHPLPSHVGSFFFHAYNPQWEVPLDFSAQKYDLVYLGNNCFRWQPLYRILRSIEPVRNRLGRIGLVSPSWNSQARCADLPLSEVAYDTDPVSLKAMDIEVMPPTPFTEAISSMSQAIANLVLNRPLFDHLQFVSCHTFETPAANTIPLFAQEATFVQEIYGERAIELLLGTDAEQKILDVLARPEFYADIVREIRHHLAQHHSYESRLKELVEIVEI